MYMFMLLQFVKVSQASIAVLVLEKLFNWGSDKLVLPGTLVCFLNSSAYTKGR